MDIREAARILGENRPSIIREVPWRAKRLNEAIDTVMLQAKPVQAELEGGGSSWWYVCEECRGMIDSSDNYCKHCGRPVEKT